MQLRISDMSALCHVSLTDAVYIMTHCWGVKYNPVRVTQHTQNFHCAEVKVGYELGS